MFEVKKTRLPRLTALAAAMALGFGLATSAGAADINSFIVSGSNQASDENREYLIDRDFVAGGPVGVVSVGDSLRGLINFNTINSGGANLGGLTGNDEFTGIFQVLVVAAIPNPINPADTLIAFAPDPAFGVTLGALGVPVVGGEIAALFTSPIIDFCADFGDAGCAGVGGGTDDGTPAGSSGAGITPPSSADVSVGPYATEEAFIATATNGQFWATLGFVGAPGEGVAGNGPTSILTAFGLTSGSSAGNINGCLNLISTGAGFGVGVTINRVTPCPFGGPVDFAFSQQLRGIADLDTAFEISTNTNVSFNASIPEPSSLLLLGGALLGLGALRRRKA